MKKPYDDIVVLDFTRYLTGPCASYILGLMGADIIKVEKPTIGEDMRQFPPFYNGESLAYPAYAANKHSICVNMRDPEGLALLKRLLPHVDVLMQNFRSGTIEKMGMDWETVHAVNPRLIMANFSAYGQCGPYSKRIAFDSIIQSECGMINTIREESGGVPYYPGGDNSGFAGALCFVSAISAAIAAREQTGEGSYLDIDMMSSVVSMFSADLSLDTAAGGPTKLHDFAPHGFFRDRDGRYVQLSCPAALWPAFMAVLAEPALEDVRFSTLESRREYKPELDAAVQNWASRHSAEEICALLESQGIGAGIVRDYKDLPDNEHIVQSGTMHQVDAPYIGKVPLPDFPAAFSSFETEYGKVSKIGEDNEYVFQRFLGLTPGEIADYTERGILYSAEHSVLKPA